MELDPVSGNTISMNANVGAVGEDVVWVGFYAQIVENDPSFNTIRRFSGCCVYVG